MAMTESKHGRNKALNAITSSLSQETMDVVSSATKELTPHDILKRLNREIELMREALCTTVNIHDLTRYGEAFLQFKMERDALEAGMEIIEKYKHKGIE